MKSAMIILAALVFAWPVVAQDQDMPPLDGIAGTGCEITGYATGAFHVHIWADYLDHKLQPNTKHGWLRLYSIRSQDRESKNREKAFADCDKWMAKISSVRDKKAKAAAEADSSHGKHR